MNLSAHCLLHTEASVEKLTSFRGDLSMLIWDASKPPLTMETPLQV